MGVVCAQMEVFKVKLPVMALLPHGPRLCGLQPWAVSSSPSACIPSRRMLPW